MLQCCILYRGIRDIALICIVSHALPGLYLHVCNSLGSMDKKSLSQSNKDKDSNSEKNSISQLVQPAINRHRAASYIFRALTIRPREYLCIYLPRVLYPHLPCPGSKPASRKEKLSVYT